MNNPFKYFIENINLFYDINGISIDYGQNSDVKISISKNAEDDFWDNKKDVAINGIIWKEWKRTRIPFLFEKDSQKEIISYYNGKAIINYDIVASAFYFLSGWNEYVNPSRDEFGRVKYKDSIINRLGIVEIPVVNYYFDILRECIQKVYNKDVKKKLWGNSHFATLITHDIDVCKSCWLEGSFSEIKKKRFFSVPKLILKRIFGHDAWLNFEEIAEIERKYNATSSFYFLAQKGKVGKWKNADYSILSRDIRKAILKLREKEHEIGVHGSFGTHNNKQIFQNDISKIGLEPIIGNRFHFLMFDPEKTVSVLEECKIKYDTTLGFAEQSGFRRSTCYPFYLYNFEKKEVSSIIEIPLIVMDASFLNQYMGISKEEALKKIYLFVDEIEKFEGVFTLLWHNTFFSDYKYTGWRKVYTDTLEYCQKKKGLLTNGKIIYGKIS